MEGIIKDLVLFYTDILIDISREDKKALDYLQKYSQEKSIAISIITVMELMIGCRNKKEALSVEKFIKGFKIINLNEITGNTSLNLIRKFRLTHGLLIADSLIAATALSLNIPLLSKNQKDYRFIDDLELINY